MNNNIDNTYQEESIDLKKYIFQVIGNWYLFVIFIFIAFSISYYVNKFTTPIYSVSATLLVEADNSRTGAENLLDGLSLFSGKKNIENEIGILQSFSLTRKVIEALDFDVSYFKIGGIKSEEIYQNSPFIIKIDTARKEIYGQPINITFLSENKVNIEIEEVFLGEEAEVEKIFSFDKDVLIGETIKNEHFSITLDYRNKDEFDFDEVKDEKYYFIINDQIALTNKYKGKLEIEPINRESSILTLSTKGEVAEKEVNFLNKLGEAYIQSGLEDKNLIAKNTIKFIDAQLGNILDSLRLAEDDLQNFRFRNKIVNLSEEGSAYLEKYEKLLTEKATLKIKAQYYDYVYEYIQKKDDFRDVIAPSTMGIEDPLLNSLIQKLGELYQEKNIMLYSATENNPALNIINLNIQNTR
ncbi:MAG: Wzz/FepE/Etk N-terminal domain-containing protein, partial [Bacteroidota bacterium]|nr:Wzz/FepE/Etk N-terminal domain-containing protein [Bacteroidota bacterium]